MKFFKKNKNATPFSKILAVRKRSTTASNKIKRMQNNADEAYRSVIKLSKVKLLHFTLPCLAGTSTERAVKPDV